MKKVIITTIVALGVLNIALIAQATNTPNLQVKTAPSPSKQLQPANVELQQTIKGTQLQGSK